MLGMIYENIHELLENINLPRICIKYGCNLLLWYFLYFTRDTRLLFNNLFHHLLRFCAAFHHINKRPMENEIVSGVSIDVKASTTSSLYIENTLLCPNTKMIIRGVASLISAKVSESEEISNLISNHPDLQFFWIKKYLCQDPLSFVSDKEKPKLCVKPSKCRVYKFIKTLYKKASFRYPFLGGGSCVWECNDVFYKK